MTRYTSARYSRLFENGLAVSKLRHGADYMVTIKGSFMTFASSLREVEVFLEKLLKEGI